MNKKIVELRGAKEALEAVQMNIYEMIEMCKKEIEKEEDLKGIDISE